MKSLIQHADRLIPNSPETYGLKKTFFNLLRYIHQQDWTGACHASTAILFVLLKEQKYEVFPYIGEVAKLPIVFDHSWIEYDGKVMDAAISNTLIQGLSFPPVLLGYDLKSAKETEFDYQFAKGDGINSEAAMISNLTIGTYMDNFPGHPKGLWGIAKELAKMQSLKFNIESAKRKWGDCNWLLKS